MYMYLCLNNSVYLGEKEKEKERERVEKAMRFCIRCQYIWENLMLALVCDKRDDWLSAAAPGTIQSLYTNSHTTMPFTVHTRTHSMSYSIYVLGWSKRDSSWSLYEYIEQPFQLMIFGGRKTAIHSLITNFTPDSYPRLASYVIVNVWLCCCESQIVIYRKALLLLKVAEVAKRIIDAEHQEDVDDDGIFISAWEGHWCGGARCGQGECAEMLGNCENHEETALLCIGGAVRRSILCFCI